MSLSSALVAIKSANSALNTLIGDRFNPNIRPQESASPSVRYTVISKTNANAMSPVIVNYRARVQMDCYASTSVNRSSLRSAVVTAFYGYAGVIGGETIRSILIDHELEGVESVGQVAEIFVSTIDFIVDFA